MASPSLFQVAAGLGVGAFVAAVFLGVVRRFGRNRGEGFETSKLGREATAIIAVLIVLIAGAATILALVIYAPRDAQGARPKALPEDALRAKEGWARGTTIILTTWQRQIRDYPKILAALLPCPAGSIPRLSTLELERAKGLHDTVFAQLEEEAHQLLLKEDADPRMVNPALRQYFSGEPIVLADGSTHSIDEMTRSGREFHERLFRLVRDDILAGRDPLQNGAILNLMRSYLDRRQAVTEALDRAVGKGQLGLGPCKPA